TPTSCRRQWTSKRPRKLPRKGRPDPVAPSTSQEQEQDQPPHQSFGRRHDHGVSATLGQMSHPLVVMALESEGQGRLEKLGCEVLYTGVGKVNAAYALTRRLHSARGCPVSTVLNLGSAGSPTFWTGTLVAADRFVQRDMDMTGLGFAHGVT